MSQNGFDIDLGGRRPRARCVWFDFGGHTEGHAMRIDSAFNSGLQGIQRGLSQTQKSANDIVDATVNKDSTVGDVTRAVVDLRQAEQQVQASAEVVKTADQLLGSIIDIKA